MENLNTPPLTIEIQVCYYLDDNGKYVFDEEEMKEELEQKLLELENLNKR
jgi:hypothetical protein